MVLGNVPIAFFCMYICPVFQAPLIEEIVSSPLCILVSFFKNNMLKSALEQVYYQGWHRSPAQVGSMRQVLRAGALRRPRGVGWGGSLERGPGRGTHVNPWLINVNVWQKTLQYCKVISLQLITINGGKQNKTKVPGFITGLARNLWWYLFPIILGELIMLLKYMLKLPNNCTHLTH